MRRSIDDQPRRARQRIATGADPLACADISRPLPNCGDPRLIAATAGIISTGRAKLVIPLADRRFLANVVMDIAALRALDLGPEVTGVYAVAPGRDGSTWHARQFPIGIGLPEDPGTGIAASAFAGYLARRAKPLDGWFEICIFQGEAMGRRCRVLGAAHVRKGAVDATRFGGRVAVERREAVTIRLATDRDAAGVLACLSVAFAPFESAYTPEAFEDTVLGPELLRKRMAAMSVFVATKPRGGYRRDDFLRPARRWRRPPPRDGREPKLARARRRRAASGRRRIRAAQERMLTRYSHHD
jgi:hypothetical protein